MRTIVWFRGKDLRVGDHAPLREAAAGGEVIPLFVLDPYFFAPARARELPHRIQYLLDALHALAGELARLGSRLVVVAGRSVDVVPRLAAAWRADRVTAHRWVEPFGRERDRRIAAALGTRFELHEGETLLPPGKLRTSAGKPFTVFSRFAAAFRAAADVGAPLAAPARLPPLPTGVEAEAVAIPTCEALGLVRNPALLAGGEAAAERRLACFLREAAARYAVDRDRMDLPGTSRLSADLKFGTISVRRVWTEAAESPIGAPAAQAFLDELLWREFAYSTLWDRPEVLKQPFQPAFAAFPWGWEERAWRAWTAGETGYPVVDAAARQLVGEGFVHNRARMVAASFLAKHLLIDFRRGEAHYMKYLTDGDWANNDLGWQWSAGCGADAQPYFRVFNPVLQGEKLDPAGNYVRRWVPELANLPARFIHRPSEAPRAVLAEAGVRLGRDYPRPIVDHRLARERFLALAGEHVRSGPRKRKGGRSPR
jgi:deoxyribodipyrimidine photo-lyase